MIIIFVALVLILGTGKLPGAARKMGKAVNEYNKAKNEIQDQIKEATEETKVDYTQDQTNANILTALYLLIDKSRGKEKGAIEEILKKLDEGTTEPSCEATAKPTLSEGEGATATRKPSKPEEEKKSDLNVLQAILKKMNIDV